MTSEVEKWSLEASRKNKLISYLLIAGVIFLSVLTFNFEDDFLPTLPKAFDLVIFGFLMILLLLYAMKALFIKGHLDSLGFEQHRVWNKVEIKFDQVKKYHVFSYDVPRRTPISITFFVDKQKHKLDLSMVERETAMNIHAFIKNRLKDIDSEYFTPSFIINLIRILA